MSTSPAITRPPSRSERLLRDTLRKDDTLRSSRPRSASSTCEDDDDDDDIFQSAILFRCSSRRNSAASALGHAHPNSFYVPDQDEHASYARLLRSSSYSGSSRSGRSDRRTSPRPTNTQEKQGESSRHHDAAPHEAVLRSRLDAVMHSMRIDNDRDGVNALAHVQFSTASLPSSLGSTSNSRTHSHESHQTAPDSDPCAPCTSRQKRFSPGEHRHTQSVSAVHPQPVSPRRTSPQRVPLPSPRTPRSPPGLPKTPTSQEKERIKRRHPDSPWMYAPLPPSPPAFSTSSPKRAGPAVVAFVAGPPMIDAHMHIPTHSSARHSPNSTSFDPDAASHA
ncbi:hypothetical protein JVU11DRAFT_2901 [Chiua virens]|nr:hypothetical protein JVU11DRAFT_2901 [Chiua virens]